MFNFLDSKRVQKIELPPECACVHHTSILPLLNYSLTCDENIETFKVDRNSLLITRKDVDKHCDVTLKMIRMDLYEIVYTIGCFDRLHTGHRILIETMKMYGKRVVVGIHDSKSISELKDIPLDGIQDVETRRKNVESLGCETFVITSTDPTDDLVSNYKQGHNLFIRSDDNHHFPGRVVVEQLMDIILVPYHEQMSSSMIRKGRGCTMHIERVLRSLYLPRDRFFIVGNTARSIKNTGVPGERVHLAFKCDVKKPLYIGGNGYDFYAIPKASTSDRVIVDGTTYNVCFDLLP